MPRSMWFFPYRADHRTTDAAVDFDQWTSILQIKSVNGLPLRLRWWLLTCADYFFVRNEFVELRWPVFLNPKKQAKQWKTKKRIISNWIATMVNWWCRTCWSSWIFSFNQLEFWHKCLLNTFVCLDLCISRVYDNICRVSLYWMQRHLSVTQHSKSSKQNSNDFYQISLLLRNIFEITLHPVKIRFEAD